MKFFNIKKEKFIKIFSYLIIPIILITLSSFTNAINLTNFSDGSSTGNFTYITSTEWYTKSINITEGRTVSNAFIWLNGYIGASQIEYNFQSDTKNWFNDSLTSNVSTILCSQMSPYPNNCIKGVTRVVTDSSPYTKYSGWNLDNKYAGTMQNVSFYVRPQKINGQIVALFNSTGNFTTGFGAVTQAQFTASDMLILSGNCSWLQFNPTNYNDVFFKITEEINFPGRTLRVYLNDTYKKSCSLNSGGEIKMLMLTAAGANYHLIVSNFTINSTTIVNYSFPTNVTLILNNKTNIFNYGNNNGSSLNHLVMANLTSFLTMLPGFKARYASQ